MGTTTPVETDEEREAREAAALEEQERLDNGGEFADDQAGDDDAPAGMADGQTTATRVEAPPEEIRVAGTQSIEQAAHAGGKRATHSEISLKGLTKIAVLPGQAFDKSQLIRFEGVAVVVEQRHKDKLDKATAVATDSVFIFECEPLDVRLFRTDSPRLPDDAGLAERLSTAIELLGSDEPDVGTVLDLLKQGLG